jgi:putative chitinase
MSENLRGSAISFDPNEFGNGPYLARVVNHLDPTFMGMLEVTIMRDIPGQGKIESANVTVKYCSPFFGSTAQKFEGPDSSKFDDVQKSYGFWMVPPDIGTIVMVMFIDGQPGEGYWFGCVPDMYQNYMTPGIAASQYTALSPEEEKKYGTKYLPVAEYHKKSRQNQIPTPDTFTKPVHPFADRLLQQGLLLDTIRGVTSSSARREVPSSVFGISTPGPIDKQSPAKQAGFEKSGSVISLPVSRLGGTQFVMDDGDKNGQNELVRIRTRTGHQILLHNSSDLIYISNSKGTAWVELTSNGKIDIFAEDSVSIRTEQDFNFRADRDINLEAGRNINISAASGLEMNAVDRFYLVCDGEGKINIDGNAHVAVGADIRMQSGGSTNILSGDNIFINTNGDINQSAGKQWKVSATGNTNISTVGDHRETAANIHMNGPGAVNASAGTSPTPPAKLARFNVPNRSSKAGWSDGNFYKAGNLLSIMQRVPTHEPWDQHENINPSQFSAASTNVQVNQPADNKPAPTSGSGGAGGAGNVPINASPVAVPTTKNAAANEQYLQSVLINAGITDPIKLAQWMAQCKHESGNFNYLQEIASGAAYEGRTDLGNNQAGDGPRFNGRGFIQVTGRVNYESMTKYFGTDFVGKPELVEQLEWAAKTVIWFFNVARRPGFKNRTMTQAYSDTTAFWDDTLSVSALVNGGKNGLAHREQCYADYKKKFTNQGITPSGVVGTGGGSVLTSGTGLPVQSGNPQ